MTLRKIFVDATIFPLRWIPDEKRDLAARSLVGPAALVTDSLRRSGGIGLEPSWVKLVFDTRSGAFDPEPYATGALGNVLVLQPPSMGSVAEATDAADFLLAPFLAIATVRGVSTNALNTARTAVIAADGVYQEAIGRRVDGWHIRVEFKIDRMGEGWSRLLASRKSEERQSSWNHSPPYAGISRDVAATIRVHSGVITYRPWCDPIEPIGADLFSQQVPALPVDI